MRTRISACILLIPTTGLSEHLVDYGASVRRSRSGRANLVCSFRWLEPISPCSNARVAVSIIRKQVGICIYHDRTLMSVVCKDLFVFF